ncbi:MAG: carboxypeptidase-like regulatory domain-containing protein [Ignavibacteriales bacterium]|nr:carboxypeptidase-like regulatory domain-containing protein [Ignavibacteriales bacterium]
MILKFFIPLILLFTSSAALEAQKGKLFGRVIDAGTSNPLLAASIFLSETQLGAASIQNGEYIITNIPEGIYKVECSLEGYKPTIIENVKISSGSITKLDIQLKYEGKNVWLPDDLEAKLLKDLPAEVKQNLIEVKKLDLNKYYTLLHQTSLSYTSRSGFIYNQKTESRTEKILSLDLQAELLGLQYKKVDKSEQKEIRQKVESILRDLFNLREVQRKEELKTLETKIEKLKNYTLEFSNNKEEIIKKRINELLK